MVKTYKQEMSMPPLYEPHCKLKVKADTEEIMDQAPLTFHQMMIVIPWLIHCSSPVNYQNVITIMQTKKTIQHYV